MFDYLKDGAGLYVALGPLCIREMKKANQRSTRSNATKPSEVIS